MSSLLSPPTLSDRVALVTGGAGGIGRATARALSAAGACVAVVDVNGAGAREVAADLEAQGGTAIGLEADVADESSVAGMIEETVRRLGRLDLLHNNAADSDPELMARDAAIHELEAEVWDRTMRVNLRGPMLGCKHAIPVMLEQGGGVIVNTSSASGLTGDDSRAAYGASKAGLQSLTQSVATQYGKRGIRCNAIAPGVITTPALEAVIPPAQIEVYAGNTLTPRLGRPEDIAATVVFLASDAASFITGQILSVDGGLLAHHPAVSEARKLGGAPGPAGDD